MKVSHRTSFEMFGSESEDDMFDKNLRRKNQAHKLGKRKMPLRTSDDEDDDSVISNQTPNGSVFSAANTSHPAFNGSEVARSTPELNISPELKEARSKKRSFTGDTLAQIANVINDDNEEKSRQALENHVSVANTTNADSINMKNDSKLQLCCEIASRIDVNLSSEQLSEHLTSYIQLNAANKINKNNAFNLQLIDCMFVLLNRNDKSMKDFPTMSCSLDAGTRIYACRVDNVHAGIIEIVTGLSSATDKQKKKSSRNGNGDSAGEDCENDGMDSDAQQLKRKRKRKAVMASSLEALCRNKIEPSAWMLRPSITPDFTKLLNHTSCTKSENSCVSFLKDQVQSVPELRKKQPASENKLVSVPRDTPANSSNINFSWCVDVESADDDDDGYDDNECLMDEVSFSVHNNTVISAFSHRNSNITRDEVEEGHLVPDAMTKSNLEVSSVRQSVVGEECADVLPDDDGEHHSLPDLVDDRDDDSCGNDVDDTKDVVDTAGPKNRQDTLSFVSGKALLATNDSCFSYIDSDLLPDLWVGPDYWKPKFKRGRPVQIADDGVTAAEKKTRRKTKRTDLLSFEDFSNHDSVFDKVLDKNQQTRMVSKWSEKKLTLPARKNFKMEDIYRSFCRQTLFYKPYLKQEKDDVEAKIDFEYADDGEHLFNDANKLTPPLGDGDDFVADNQSDCEDYGDPLSPPEVASTEHDEPEVNESNLFSAENLVPMPKLVQCETIKYATVPKRLDMKKLKVAIWNLLDLENNKENRKGIRKSSNIGGKIDEATFSKIYKRLPEDLPVDMRKDMSPALAFLAILHLSNEKTLAIQSIDASLTDVRIRKGLPDDC